MKEELRQNLTKSVLPDPDAQADELIRQLTEFKSEGFKKNVHKFAMYISHAKMLIFIGEGNKGQLPAMQQDISQTSVIFRLVWMIRFIRRSSIEAQVRL